MCLVNSHVLYCSVGGLTRLKDPLRFRQAVAAGLVAKAAAGKPDVLVRQVLPVAEGAVHLPVFVPTRSGCVHCRVPATATETGKAQKMNTFIKCTSCNVYLCLQKERNCFAAHHGVL